MAQKTQSRSLWAFVRPETEKRIGELLSTCRARPEFEALEASFIRPEKIEKSGWEPGGATPVVVVTEVAAAQKGLDRVVDRLKALDPPPPLIVILEEYSASGVALIYNRKYLRTMGVFRRELLGEPEGMAGFLRTLTVSLRMDPTFDADTVAVAVGSRIPADKAGKDHDDRPFVSLLLDDRMRQFMQELVFTVEQAAVPIPGKAPKDLPLGYQDVAEALRCEDKRKRAAALGEVEKQLDERGFFSPRGGDAVRPPAILLEGETGTGKTVIARWLSRNLKGEDFVHIPLVNVSETLLETELFGTVAGGFTDAVSRPGRLHQAWGGTVFLDEIGDAPPEIQAKLLVYLDKFCFRPVGWPFSREVYCPVTVVAATNRDLRAAIEKGQFREDLYHRFRYRLRVPPLRERGADLRILVDFVLQDPMINRRQDGKLSAETISEAALEKLEAYAFPGNYRELEDILSRAIFNARRAGRRRILQGDIET